MSPLVSTNLGQASYDSEFHNWQCLSFTLSHCARPGSTGATSPLMCPRALLPCNSTGSTVTYHYAGFGVYRPPKWFAYIICFNSGDKWLLLCSFFWPIWQVESVKLVSSCRHGLTMEMNVKTFIFVRNYVKLFKFIGELQQTSQLMNISVICFLENTYGLEKITLQCALPFWSKDVWREDRVCYSRS